MRSSLLIFSIGYLLFLGLGYPFIAAMVYVWIDIAKPHEQAYFFLNSLPVGMISAIVALAAYVMRKERSDIPSFNAIVALLSIFAIWMTLTTFLADPRLNAWAKWDWAFKGLIFSIFIPFLFRTRLQVECLILTIVFSVAMVGFSAGVKTAMGGGGYGVLAVMGANNQGLSEGSTLATVCIMMVPLIFYINKHTLLFSDWRFFKPAMIGVAIILVIAVIGTTARTGLVAGTFLLLRYILRSNRKFAWLIGLAVGGVLILQFNVADSIWAGRMNTIDSFNTEGSSLGRIRVWEWTLGYVFDNPMGGGFNSYMFNNIMGATAAGIINFPPDVFMGKAFHNIFFEVLGEQGYFGVTVYLTILLLTWLRLAKISKCCREHPELLWASDLATALKDALLVLLTGGMFVGIAYQSYILYVVAITLILGDLVFRFNRNSAAQF